MMNDLEFANIKPYRHRDMNVIVNGRPITISVEPTIWDSIEEIGRIERYMAKDMFDLVVSRLVQANKCPDRDAAVTDEGDETAEKDEAAARLTSGIRVFIMAYFRRLAQSKAPVGNENVWPHGKELSAMLPEVGGRRLG